MPSYRNKTIKCCKKCGRPMRVSEVGRICSSCKQNTRYGRDKTIPNFWPFDKFSTVSSPRVKRVTNVKHKGYAIYKDEDGNFLVPGLTGNDGSYFESLREAKRFIDASTRKARTRLANGPMVTIRKYRANSADWFNRCVEGVKAKGGGYDPNAVCASVMRRKKQKKGTR